MREGCFHLLRYNSLLILCLAVKWPLIKLWLGRFEARFAIFTFSFSEQTKFRNSGFHWWLQLRIYYVFPYFTNGIPLTVTVASVLTRLSACCTYLLAIRLRRYWSHENTWALLISIGSYMITFVRGIDIMRTWHARKLLNQKSLIH